MCGFVGFTRPESATAARATLDSMMASIRHRGPDGDGIHIDEGLALGHVRLAIIDLTGGAQPRLGDGGVALVFNGEIYGYRSLADGLRSDAIALADHSDTEVLFQMLCRDGVMATLRRIDGMFVFAFRDREGRLWLARDRFGEKPLFYGLRDGRLAFASELGALRRHPLMAAGGFDLPALSRFLTLQYLPGEETGYVGIRKLPPGGILCFDHGQVRVERYWRPRFSPTSAAMPHGERLERLEDRKSTRLNSSHRT